MHRRGRQLNPAFMQTAGTSSSEGGKVSEAILRQARKSGQLNLSNRQLEVVPDGVWHLNTDPPPDQVVSFDTSGDERWWDQTELVKLILATNRLGELSEDIRLLSALTVLDVHDNKLASLPHGIGELQSLTKLILSHNELTTLVPELSALTNLHHLKLDHNNLAVLPDGIGFLSHLEDFDVSHNKLSLLPPSLGKTRTLLRLCASHNMITSIPEGVGEMRGLKELSLNNNKLVSLPPLCNMDSLQILDLHCNFLTELPAVRPGTELKELRLGSNRMTTLDTVKLKPLTALVYLDLRDNKIQSIPDGIVCVKRLERLDLTNNDVSGLPYAMGHMMKLKSILLDGNPLRTIRRDIVQRGTSEIMKHLRSRIETASPQEQPPLSYPTPPRTPRGQELGLSSGSRTIDLTKKSLKTLPVELFQHTHLSELNAGHNKLTDIPPGIGQLRALTVLDLRNNQLSILPAELTQCSELRDIVLSFNRLRELPPVLYSLKKLENIITSDNQIAAIDVDGLLQLPLVACLDLQNNDIGHIPPQLGNVTSLKHLQLGGNPFRNPRAAILAKGTASLLEYLRDRIPT